MNGQLNTLTFEESFERNTTTLVTVNDNKVYAGKTVRTSLEKTRAQVYRRDKALYVFNTISTNIQLYDSEVSETRTTKWNGSSFSDEELWSYLIDNDSNVIMPPKRSYYIKANIVKIVRGKPSKAD